MKSNHIKYIIFGIILVAVSITISGYYGYFNKFKEKGTLRTVQESNNFQIITKDNKSKYQNDYYKFSFNFPIYFIPSLDKKKNDFEEIGAFTSEQFIYKRNNGDRVPYKILLLVRDFYRSSDGDEYLNNFKELSQNVCKERSQIISGNREFFSSEYCKQNTVYGDYITDNGFQWLRAALKSGTWGFDFDVLVLSFPLRNGVNPSEVTGIVALIPHFDYAIPVENNNLESKIVSFSKNFEYNFDLPDPPINEFWDRSAGYSITIPDGYTFKPYPSALGGSIYSTSQKRVAYIDWQQIEVPITEENLEKNVLLFCAADGPSGSQYCDKVIQKEKVFGQDVEGYKFFMRQIYEYYDDVTNMQKQTETTKGPFVVFLLPGQKNAISFTLEDDTHRKEFEQIYTSFRYLSNFERTGLLRLIELPKETIEGIGVFFGTSLEIEYVVPDTPADKAGLSAGDKILKINNIDAATLTQKQAIDYIKGPKGTKVRLTILKKGQVIPVDIDITRDVIIVP